MRTKKTASPPLPAKLDEMDLLKLQNLTLRAEALNNERIALGGAFAAKYFPGLKGGSISITPDGTVSIA